MLFCLIGQSSSGKSTIEKKLSEKGFKNITSYTTREIRDNEVDGKDYHFLSREEFKKLMNDGYFHEVAVYRDNFYGISLEGINLSEEDYIAVVTVHGYRELAKHTKDIVAIHIQVDERERIIRQLKRGDEVDEVIRRIQADRLDFHDVLDVSVHVVENKSLERSVDAIEFIMKNESQRW